MSPLLTLETARSDAGKLMLLAAGEIDLSNIEAFKQALDTASAEAEANSERFTVDLSAVEYLDSAAINALFTHANDIDLISNPLLVSALTMSGLAELVTIETAAAATDF